MQYISQDLLYFIRAVIFGVVLGYAFFYIFLYSKPIVENIIGGKRLDTDLWWIVMVSLSIVFGVIGAILLM